MNRTTRPGDARVSLDTVAAFLGMLAMTAVLAGCGQGSGGSPPSNDRGGEVLAVNVAGTWTGTFYGKDAEGRATLSLTQDGERLSGNLHAASEEGYGYLGPLEGTTERAGDAAGEVSLAKEGYPTEDGGEGVVRLDGSVEGGSVMTGSVRYPEDMGSYELDLRRTDLSSAEGFAEAAVQSMYDRNFIWLAEHADVDWRETSDTPSTEGLAEDTEEAFARETDDDYEAPLPAGVGVDLVGESVVAYESGPTTELDAEYETSDGATGFVNVDLIEAGTAEAGYGYRIRSITLEYEVDGQGNALTLGAGNY